MESNLLALSAVVLGSLAIYAQLTIPRFSRTARTTMATRLILAGTGIALGVVSAALFPEDAGQAMLAFISGFGVVHLPAAIILLLKHAQRASR